MFGEICRTPEHGRRLRRADHRPRCACRELSRAAGPALPARAAGVVKADAYGLGAARVAPALHEAGCRDFFVAHLSEALRLRPVLAADARLFVLNGLQPGAEAPCADAGIVPVLNSLEQVANWSALAKARGLVLPAALQFDTGMSRLGLSPDEAEQLVADPRGSGCAPPLPR